MEKFKKFAARRKWKVSHSVLCAVQITQKPCGISGLPLLLKKTLRLKLMKALFAVGSAYHLLACFDSQKQNQQNIKTGFNKFLIHFFHSCCIYLSPAWAVYLVWLCKYLHFKGRYPINYISSYIT